MDDRLVKTIDQTMSLDEMQKIKIRYGLLVLKSEGVKLMIMLIIYSLLGMAQLFLFSLLVLIPVRLFSGGLHMKTNAGCLFVSLLFFTLCMAILPCFSLPDGIYDAMLLTSVVIIGSLSPIASAAKPIVSHRKRCMCKRNTALLCIVNYSLIMLLPLPVTYFRCGVWLMVVQASQLMLSLMINHNRYRSERSAVK